MQWQCPLTHGTRMGHERCGQLRFVRRWRCRGDAAAAATLLRCCAWLGVAPADADAGSAPAEILKAAVAAWRERPASALPSLTAPSLREPAPPSPRSLYVRGIILGYKRYVDGPTAEPLPRVARRARRERRKTRRVFRARRAPRRGPGRPTRDSKRGNDGVSRAVRESFGRRSPSGTRAVVFRTPARRSGALSTIRRRS